MDNPQGAALSALFWWIIPITAFIGAIIYVVWVTRFKSKYENEVNRSVGRFQRFQDSLANKQQEIEKPEKSTEQKSNN